MWTNIASVVKRYIPRSYRPLFRAVYHRGLRLGRSMIHHGNRYHCPICGSNLRRFKPGGACLPQFKDHKLVGIGFRENRECPVCLATDKERHQFLCMTVNLKVLSSSNRTRLLHIAPEPNPRRILEALPQIRYTAADLESPEVHVQLDICHLPFASRSFDAVLCSHVLEHVAEDRQAMGEVFRVLAPGGWAILQVPVALSMENTVEESTGYSAEERLARFGQVDHVRLYGRDYVQRLRQAGFDVELYNHASRHGEQAARRYGLMVNEDVYVCWKLPRCA